MAYLTGDVPTGELEITFRVPNEEMIRRAALAQIYYLREESMWEQFGAATPDEVAASIAALHDSITVIEL